MIYRYAFDVVLCELKHKIRPCDAGYCAFYHTGGMMIMDRQWNRRSGWDDASLGRTQNIMCIRNFSKVVRMDAKQHRSFMIMTGVRLPRNY